MNIKHYLRNSLCIGLVLLQIVAFPSFSIAQEAVSESSDTPATSESTPAASDSTDSTSSDPSSSPAAPSSTSTSTQGPTSPTGADSKKYTKNADGTWTNGYYTWNPVTKQTSPNQPQEYSYNPATGRWDTTEYVYQPESGKYVPNVVSSATNPSSSAAIASSGPTSTASATPLSITNTGPNSNNSINLGANLNGVYDLFYNGTISNKLVSNAVTGNALVSGNTMGGSALTGDADAIANVLNMLQSGWTGQSGDIATFISNIDGDLYGDLTFDPGALPYNLGSTNSNVDVNIANNGVIDNDINLTATSGNAGVTKNTTGGNATSGNARAVANVINMINSAIKSGQSFLGTININGNLDGDILLPPGVLDALIASTGPNSNNTLGGSTNANLDANSTANRTINNNVTTTATTGNATVDKNTNAGNATSGQSNTSINSMNLIGQNIKAKNGLLVFVNVLGKWVGMVVDPTTGAVIANSGPNSNNTIGGNSNLNASVNSTENSLINNKINATATSGDATVANNTTAGNATSGNADVSVNLLNMIGSNIETDDWFGVLFINVFGQWFGSFGADTANGNAPVTATSSNNSGGSANSSSSTATTNNTNSGSTPVFGFVARSFASGQFDAGQPVTSDQSNTNQTVFGSSTPSDSDGTTGTSSTVTSGPQLNWWIIAGSIGLIATITVLAREYLLALREERLA